MSLSIVLASLVLGVSAQTQAPPPRIQTRTGNLTVVADFESKILGNKRRLWVYLPPDYDQKPRERYPVVYLHDGQNVFDGMTSYIPNAEWKADEAAEAMIRAGLLRPLILVGIDNAQADRANEYLPMKLSDREGQSFGGNANLYGRFLIEEVKPYVDRTYRTRRGPSDTGLIGSSFGGVITMHLGLERSDVFGKLGIVSPSLWVGNEALIRRAEQLPRKLPLRIWLDMGSREGGGIQQARRLEKVFLEKGWQSGRDLIYFEDNFAEHNEPAWARRLPLMLSFLFGR